MRISYPVKKKLSLKDNLKTIIPLVYDNFMSFRESVVIHLRRKDLLHRMRISGKPMRYAMELLENHSTVEFKQCLEEVKYMIEMLGDVHDCDVFITELVNHLKEIRAFNRGIENSSEKISTRSLRELIFQLRKKRTDKFTEFIIISNRWIKQNFRRKIIESLNS